MTSLCCLQWTLTELDFYFEEFSVFLLYFPAVLILFLSFLRCRFYVKGLPLSVGHLLSFYILDLQGALSACSWLRRLRLQAVMRYCSVVVAVFIKSGVKLRPLGFFLPCEKQTIITEAASISSISDISNLIPWLSLAE